jgi:hypothetical protein
MSDPLWYKDAIIYELHVKTFHDSDGDGMGDFRGLIEKLDYLQELGVTAIWLLPFYPSPMRDDGYDIADYFDVNPNFGTLDDFRAFLDAAHERNLRVITELVINHTSDQNPWFQKSRRAMTRRRARRKRPRLQRLLCLERYAGKIQGRANHFQRFRDIELGVGSGGEGLLLASLLFASAGPEFR